MSTLQEDTQSTAGSWQCWAWSAGSPVVGALVVWGVSRLGDVDLTVGSGDQRRTVGVLSVLVASALAGLAGTALLRMLQHQQGTIQGRKVWTAIAGVAFVVSLLLGPLSAATATGMITLACMHLVVLVALLGSAWRRPAWRR
jgi:hypothetical protein